MRMPSVPAPSIVPDGGRHGHKHVRDRSSSDESYVATRRRRTDYSPASDTGSARGQAYGDTYTGQIADDTARECDLNTLPAARHPALTILKAKADPATASRYHSTKKLGPFKWDDLVGLWSDPNAGQQKRRQRIQKILSRSNITAQDLAQILRQLWKDPNSRAGAKNGVAEIYWMLDLARDVSQASQARINAPEGSRRRQQPERRDIDVDSDADTRRPRRLPQRRDPTLTSDPGPGFEGKGKGRAVDSETHYPERGSSTSSSSAFSSRHPTPGPLAVSGPDQQVSARKKGDLMHEQTLNELLKQYEDGVLDSAWRVAFIDKRGYYGDSRNAIRGTTIPAWVKADRASQLSEDERDLIVQAKDMKFGNFRQAMQTASKALHANPDQVSRGKGRRIYQSLLAFQQELLGTQVQPATITLRILKQFSLARIDDKYIRNTGRAADQSLLWILYRLTDPVGDARRVARGVYAGQMRMGPFHLDVVIRLCQIKPDDFLEYGRDKAALWSTVASWFADRYRKHQAKVEHRVTPATTPLGQIYDDCELLAAAPNLDAVTSVQDLERLRGARTASPRRAQAGSASARTASGSPRPGRPGSSSAG